MLISPMEETSRLLVARFPPTYMDLVCLLKPAAIKLPKKMFYSQPINNLDVVTSLDAVSGFHTMTGLDVMTSSDIVTGLNVVIGLDTVICLDVLTG